MSMDRPPEVPPPTLDRCAAANDALAHIALLANCFQQEGQLLNVFL